MKLSKVFYLVSIHTLVLTSLFLTYILFTLIYPYKIVELHKDPFPVDKQIYKAGEKVHYTLDFTKNYNFKPTISYSLVDGFILKLSHGGSSRPVGEQKHTLYLTIPESTPPGIYNIQIDLSYEINKFRNINYTWRSEKFKVVKGGE